MFVRIVSCDEVQVVFSKKSCETKIFVKTCCKLMEN